MSTPDQRRPDLEDLAAYVDDRLDAASRSAVELRLLQDEGYYQDYLGVLAFLDEEGEVAPSAPQTGPWRKWLPYLGPLAALLILALAWRVLTPPNLEDLVGGLQARSAMANEAWDRPGWTPARSANALPSGLSRTQLAFRLGARSVDLEVALRAEEHQASQLASERLAALCDELQLYQRQEYRALAQELSSPAMVTRALLARSRAISSSLKKSLGLSSADERAIDAGRWLQASRLAALTRDHETLSHLAALVPAEIDKTSKAKLIEALETDRSQTESSGVAWSEVIEILEAMALEKGG